MKKFLSATALLLLVGVSAAVSPSITINNPTPNFPVSQKFTAYGTCDQSGCQFLVEVTDETRTWTGAYATPPMGQQWAADFDLPRNTPFLMTVYAKNKSGDNAVKSTFFTTAP